MKISDLLKEIRAEYNLTQAQLSEKIFVSRKTISNWENNKTVPDIDSLIRLANLFELSLDDLLLEKSIRDTQCEKKTNLTNVKHMCFITFCMNMIFLFALFTQNTFGKMTFPVEFAVVLGTITNIVLMLYFGIKSSRAKEIPHSKISLFHCALVCLLFLILSLYLDTQ